VTFTIDRPVDVALRLRVGGLARIPAGLEVRVPDLDPGQTGGDRPVDRDLREDPETAEVAFRWLPMPGGEAPPVTLRAEGLPEVVVTPSRDADGVWRAVVEFSPGATLKVRVTRPEGVRYHLQLERWDEADGRWTFRYDDPGYQAGLRAVDGVHTFAGLASGRYRLTEHYTNRSSDPVELRGGEVVEVTFDLTSLVVVKGRVEVPAGENPAYASVQVEGREQGAVSAMNPVWVRADGTFEFRATNGERLALVGRHPQLRPSGEPVAFTAGSEEPGEVHEAEAQS
jgi:hypothetical protein